MRHVGLSVVVAALAVGSAVGCSGSVSVGGKSLDQAAAESQITTGLTEAVGVAPEAVDCDGISDIDVEEGSTFQCTGTAPNGDTFPIDVTLTNDEGGFNYEVPG